MVLDRQGGPNWKKNWCIAPVIVDPDKDEVYFTPLYYVMAHFSKFIRPGAKVVEVKNQDKNLQITAAENPDQSIAVIVFNEGETEKTYTLKINTINKTIRIAPQAIQTVVIN